MTLKRQVPSVAAAIFLALNVVNVLSECIPSYWSNGNDDFGGSADCRLYVWPPGGLNKQSYWAVQFPGQWGYNDVISYGTGQCTTTKQCWPIFYPSIPPKP